MQHVLVWPLYLPSSLPWWPHQPAAAQPQFRGLTSGLSAARPCGKEPDPRPLGYSQVRRCGGGQIKGLDLLGAEPTLTASIPPPVSTSPWVEKNTPSRDKKRGAQHQWGDHVPHAGIPGGLSDLHSRFWSWEGVEGLIITLLSSTGSPGLVRGAGCCFHTGWVPPAWVGITGAIVLGTWWIQRGWEE